MIATDQSVIAPRRPGHIPELDGLRAISVLFVMLVHVSYGRVSGGILGVDVFFVLSGYLITTLLMKEYARNGKVDLYKFYMRRALRILPPLVVCVVLALLFWQDGAPSRWQAAVAALFFYANFLDPIAAGSLAHTWSLAIEEQFYILWPTVFIMIFPRSSLGMRGLAAVTILFVIATRTWMLRAGWDHNAIYSATPARMDSLMVGCLLALTADAMTARLARLPNVFAHALTLIVAFALIGALLFATRDGMQSSPLAFTGFAILAAAMILLSQGTEQPVGRLLRSQGMQYVGRRSYGLYLYHYPIFALLEGMRSPGDLTNYAFVSGLKVALSIAVAEASWRLVEQPILRLKVRCYAVADRSGAETMLKEPESTRQ